jgi:hypothetical protein
MRSVAAPIRQRHVDRLGAQRTVKAKPSVDKTRRVIRLALAWAAELVGGPSKRKRAEPELAVPQDVAEAAPDEVQALIAISAN